MPVFIAEDAVPSDYTLRIPADYRYRVTVDDLEIRTLSTWRQFGLPATNLTK